MPGCGILGDYSVHPHKLAVENRADVKQHQKLKPANTFPNRGSIQK